MFNLDSFHVYLRKMFGGYRLQLVERVVWDKLPLQFTQLYRNILNYMSNNNGVFFKIKYGATSAFYLWIDSSGYSSTQERN